MSVWKKSKYKVFKGGRSWECLIMAGVAGAEILKRVRGGLRGNGDQIMMGSEYEGIGVFRAVNKCRDPLLNSYSVSNTYHV